MEFLQLFLRLRKVRQAFKKAGIVKAAKLAEVAAQTEAIATQAAAYGYEIGFGREMRETVTTSPHNPFLRSNWRDEVIKDA